MNIWVITICYTLCAGLTLEIQLLDRSGLYRDLVGNAILYRDFWDESKAQLVKIEGNLQVLNDININAKCNNLVHTIINKIDSCKLRIREIKIAVEPRRIKRGIANFVGSGLKYFILT